MNAKDKLAELINQAIDTYATMPLVNGCRPQLKYFLADYLLANGVVVVDMNVVSPKNRPLISQCLGRPIDEIIELVNAKDEGRILVLPCKVGDTVYSISGGKVAKGTAESIHQNLVGNERGRWIVTAWFDDFYANTKEAGFECGTHLYPPFDNFGKTVFLSRELAEKALAERSKRK